MSLDAAGGDGGNSTKKKKLQLRQIHPRMYPIVVLLAPNVLFFFFF